MSETEESSLSPTVSTEATSGPDTDQGVEVFAGDPTGAVQDDIGRLDAIEGELSGVEAALQRLDQGSYGTCEVCGEGLSVDLMERNPLATRCSDHGG